MKTTALPDWMNNYVTLRDFLFITGYTVDVIREMAKCGMPLYTYNCLPIGSTERRDIYYLVNLKEALVWLSMNITPANHNRLLFAFKSILE